MSEIIWKKEIPVSYRLYKFRIQYAIAEGAYQIIRVIPEIRDIRRGRDEITGKYEYFWYGFKKPTVFLVAIGYGKGGSGVRYAWVTDKSKVIFINGKPFNTVLSSKFVQKHLIIASVLEEILGSRSIVMYDSVLTIINKVWIGETVYKILKKIYKKHAEILSEIQERIEALEAFSIL